MTAFRKLEELNVWTASRRFVPQVYKLTRGAAIKHDYVYSDQIRRAALSVMSNIAEGFGRYSDKEFARFLYIARGSAMETKSLLFLGLDLSYLDEEKHSELDDTVSHVVAQLTSLAQYLSGDLGQHSQPDRSTFDV